MIIKATRLQAWAPVGWARVGRRPPPPPLPRVESEKSFLAILGAFLLLFLDMGASLLLFLDMGAFLLLFTSWWGPFLGLAPPLQKFLRAPMIAIRRVREHAPRKIFCVPVI